MGNMILIAMENLYRNIGSKNEKLSFIKFNGYKYLPLDSSDNQKQIKGENGVVVFNNEEFYKYFKTPEEFAINFAEWICKQGLNSVNIVVSPKWSPGFMSKDYTTKELFELYKEKLNKK